MNITVNVTEDDIRNGKQSCELCPIALAVKRATGADLVQAGPEYIGVHYKDKVFRYPTPHFAELFMSSFDNGYRPQPFSFELTA